MDKLPDVGVPKTGVTNVGDVANTKEPEPVSSVTAAARFALDGVAKNVATFVPNPLTPVEMGKPVALVNVPLDGVPNAPPFTTNAPAVPVLTARAVATPVPKPLMPLETGNPVALVSVPEDGVPSAPPLTTNAPADPVLTPSAVTTPVPVVIVLGAAPAPPPTTIALAASAPEDAQVVPDEKYGIPPDVPATVRASVPEDVTGDPATEIRPPVKDCPTDVTVPEFVAAMEMEPEPFVMLMPLPAVSVALDSVLPVELPMSNWPSV